MDLWTRAEAAEAVELDGWCKNVGVAMGPLVGNGILIGFAGQAFLSLCLCLWVFFLTTHGNMDITHPEGSSERAIQRKRLEFVSSILMTGCDIQSTLGIAYLVTAFSQDQLMDLYHSHLVFDIASFVGVSNTAALVCWRFCREKLGEKDANVHHGKKLGSSFSANLKRIYLDSHYRATFIFLALYLAFLILLGIRLNEWAPDAEPGRCYYSYLVTSPGASHPAMDQVYISVTGSWLIVIVLAGVFAGVKNRRWILIFAFLHFPLHLYMSIAMRLANDGKFSGEEENENEWDFGQTTAVLLLGMAFVELLVKGREFYEFEKEAVKQGMCRLTSSRSLGEIEEARPSYSPLKEARSSTDVSPGLEE